MVDAKPMISQYKCGNCGNLYFSKELAEKCCAKKKVDWELVTEFVLKQEHLDLLKNAYISWSYCEFGAPGINPKRPYGNSDVESDMLKILNLKGKSVDYIIDLHRQTQIALQIVLSCQSFKLGKYKKLDYKSWEFVE